MSIGSQSASRLDRSSVVSLRKPELIDYDKTYTTIVKLVLLKVILALVVYYGYEYK
jgi:hypothetical protein